MNCMSPWAIESCSTKLHSWDWAWSIARICSKIGSDLEPINSLVAKIPTPSRPILALAACHHMKTLLLVGSIESNHVETHQDCTWFSVSKPVESSKQLSEEKLMKRVANSHIRETWSLPERSSDGHKTYKVICSTLSWTECKPVHVLINIRRIQ